jgi:RNA polymerase sigma-70 factor (ECF subfamily)
MSELPTTIVDAEDEQLVLWSMKGNLTAYDEIVRRYQQYMASCLYRFCATQADLEDLVQETFIRAFRKLNKWKPQYPFRSWLRKIGFNLGYDYLRKNRRNPLFLQKDAVVSDSGDETQNPIERISDSDTDHSKLEGTRDLIAWLLAHLKPDEAMIISLMYVDQLSVLEISERTGWSESKIKVKAHRTRGKLKKLFNQHETEVFELSAVV